MQKILTITDGKWYFDSIALCYGRPSTIPNNVLKFFVFLPNIVLILLILLHFVNSDSSSLDVIWYFVRHAGYQKSCFYFMCPFGSINIDSKLDIAAME